VALRRVLSLSSPAALLASGGVDGSLCFWLRPHDCVELARFSTAAGPTTPGGALPPSFVPAAYDLPAWASLPLYRIPGACSDAIWALAQVPAGYSLPWPAPSPQASCSGLSLTFAHPVSTVDTSHACVVVTGSADCSVRVWLLGLDTSTGAPAHQLLASLDVLALAAAAGVGLSQDPAISASSGGPRLSSLVVDFTSAATAAVLVGLTSRHVLRLDLVQRAVTMHTRAPYAWAGALQQPPAPEVLPSSILPQPAAAPDLAGSVPGQVTCTALHPLLPYLFAGHHDAPPHTAGEGGGDAAAGTGSVAVFDTRSGALLHAFPAHVGAVTSLAVDASGQLLVSTGNDGDVRVWSIDSRECVWRSKAHAPLWGAAAQCATLHPTRAGLLLTCGGDALVKTFSAKSSARASGAAAALGAPAAAAATAAAHLGDLRLPPPAAVLGRSPTEKGPIARRGMLEEPVHTDALDAPPHAGLDLDLGADSEGGGAVGLPPAASSFITAAAAGAASVAPTLTAEGGESFHGATTGFGAVARGSVSFQAAAGSRRASLEARAAAAASRRGSAIQVLGSSTVVESLGQPDLDAASSTAPADAITAGAELAPPNPGAEGGRSGLGAFITSGGGRAGHGRRVGASSIAMLRGAGRDASAPKAVSSSSAAEQA